MSNLNLFLAGLVVTITAATAVVGLVLAAMADGRENDLKKQKS